MKRFSPVVLIVAGLVYAGQLPAGADVPRGVVLVANEQEADDKTGITIARGNAAISVAQRAVEGRAGTIELNPVEKKIFLKGDAVLTIGKARYQSQQIVCTLDFYSCKTDADGQPPSDADVNAVTSPR